MGDALAALLDAAAAGRYPPADGGVTLLPQPSPRDAGVIAFTAHSVIFVDFPDGDPSWIRAELAATGCDPLAAAMNARFLTALLTRRCAVGGPAALARFRPSGVVGSGLSGR